VALAAAASAAAEPTGDSDSQWLSKSPIKSIKPIKSIASIGSIEIVKRGSLGLRGPRFGISEVVCSVL
jgi:hypothetical protein